MERQPARFASGNEVLFRGPQYSCYGVNNKAKKYAGKIVTIKNIHPSGYPYAYTFEEFESEIRSEYWFSEGCFEEVVMELPEFEASGSLELLF